jgi:hypothetical protein
MAKSNASAAPLDEACLQILALIRMIGVDHVSVSVDRRGHVVIFAADGDDPDEDPPWSTHAQVGGTVHPDWQDLPGPTGAIREDSEALARLARSRMGVLTPEERRAKMRIVK